MAPTAGLATPRLTHQTEAIRSTGIAGRVISDPETLVQGSWEATGRQDIAAVTHAESLGM